MGVILAVPPTLHPVLPIAVSDSLLPEPEAQETVSLSPFLGRLNFFSSGTLTKNVSEIHSFEASAQILLISHPQRAR